MYLLSCSMGIILFYLCNVRLFYLGDREVDFGFENIRIIDKVIGKAFDISFGIGIEQKIHIELLR